MSEGPTNMPESNEQKSYQEQIKHIDEFFNNLPEGKPERIRYHDGETIITIFLNRSEINIYIRKNKDSEERTRIKKNDTKYEIISYNKDGTPKFLIEHSDIPELYNAILYIEGKMEKSKNTAEQTRYALTKALGNNFENRTFLQRLKNQIINLFQNIMK